MKSLLISFLLMVGLNAFSQTPEEWKLTSVPKATIRTIAVKDSEVYAGTTGNGVYKSTDNGVVWQQINEGELHLSVNALETSHDTVFAGTRNGLYYKAGNNPWKVFANTPLPNETRIYSLVKKGKYLFGGSKDGVYKITPGSKAELLKASDKWTTDIYVYSVTSHNNTLYVGAGDGLYLSKDNGNSWVYEKSIPATTVGAVEFIGNKIFVGTDGQGIYRFINGSWESANRGLSTSKIFSLVHANGKLFCGTDQGVFISHDEGENWLSFNLGLDISKPVIVNTLNYCNRFLYAGTEGGLYKVKLQ